jgi:hypothetical protein
MFLRHSGTAYVIATGLRCLMVLKRRIDYQDGLNIFGNSTSLVHLVKFEC